MAFTTHLLSCFLLALLLSATACLSKQNPNNHSQAAQTTAPPTAAPSQQAPPGADQPDGWFSKKKQRLLDQLRTAPDSTNVAPVEDPQFEEVKEFSQGFMRRRLIRHKDGRPLYEYIYSPDGFELRRMFCGNGQLAFEGLALRGEFYGLSTWWHCNGSLDHYGIRYADKKVGRWPYFREDGSPDYEENFGLLQYLDSLRMVE